MPPEAAAIAILALSKLALSLEGDIFERADDHDELVQLDTSGLRPINRTVPITTEALATAGPGPEPAFLRPTVRTKKVSKRYPPYNGPPLPCYRCCSPAGRKRATTRMI